MLALIYGMAVDVMIERQHSHNVYCGWGTFIDDAVDEYISKGGSYSLARKVLNLAYYSN